MEISVYKLIEALDRVLESAMPQPTSTRWCASG